MPGRESISGIFYPMNDVWRARIRTLGWIFLAGGVLVAIVSIIYFTVPGDSLPTILGRLRSSGIRYRRGTAMAILAGLLWILGGVALTQAGKGQTGPL